MGIRNFLEKLFGKTGSGSVETESSGRQKNGNGEGSRLVCVDCKSTFLFEAGEQKFFKMRGLTPPKRCPSCRSKRKRR